MMKTFYPGFVFFISEDLVLDLREGKKKPRY